MKTRVTVESITADLDRITAGAEAADQWGAAKGAVETKARLHGLMVDRKESGAPGEFGTLQTADQVLERVRAELGDATADALAASLTQPVAAVALVEPEVEPFVTPGPGTVQ